MSSPPASSLDFSLYLIFGELLQRGLHVLTNPWWDGITLGAAALCFWAWRLLRLPQRT